MVQTVEVGVMENLTPSHKEEGDESPYYEWFIFFICVICVICG